MDLDVWVCLANVIFWALLMHHRQSKTKATTKTFYPYQQQSNHFVCQNRKKNRKRIHTQKKKESTELTLTQNNWKMLLNNDCIFTLCMPSIFHFGWLSLLFLVVSLSFDSVSIFRFLNIWLKLLYKNKCEEFSEFLICNFCRGRCVCISLCLYAVCVRVCVFFSSHSRLVSRNWW